MRRAVTTLAVAIVFSVWPQMGQASPEKLRVIIETDLGGDPDDQASFVRWLLYVNEWDVEGMITTRPPGSRQGHGHAIAKRTLGAYGQVVENLKRHQSDYPSHEFLMDRLKDGTPSSNAGRDLIIAVIDKDDDRPVWYGNWGCDDGTESSLKRALDKVKRERSGEEYRKFIGKIRLTAELGQRHFRGHTRAFSMYLDTFYPSMDGGRWYHRWKPLTAKAGGFDIERDVKRNHGPLGALYTIQKEGDTPVFMHLLPTGLRSHVHPSWGGWSGRFGPRDDRFQGPSFWWANVRDAWEGKTHRDNTLRRWAVHLQNDFKARMDWCVKAPDQANHEPVVRVAGKPDRRVTAGTVVTLDASGAGDPDGDGLSFRWTVYPEPGAYRGPVPISGSRSKRASFRAPPVESEKTLHVILEVTDDGTPELTRYQRVVTTVVPR